MSADSPDPNETEPNHLTISDVRTAAEATDTPDRDPKTIDDTCPYCGEHLSPSVGVHSDGYSRVSAVCTGDCRLQGRGDVAIVELSNGDQPLSDRVQKSLARRRKSTNAQSVTVAAAYIDGDHADGTWVFRRAAPAVIEVEPPASVDVLDARPWLDAQLWDVIQHDGRTISLVDPKVPNPNMDVIDGI